jgi:hypothetical protein
MTKADVDALLPDILPAVRAWVAQLNSARPEDLHDDQNVGDHSKAVTTAASAVDLQNVDPRQRR